MFLMILILRFSVSRAHLKTPIYFPDNTKYFPVNLCSYYGQYCNPQLDNPCCHQDNECKVLEITTNERVYRCLKLTMVGDYCSLSSECLSLDNGLCSSSNRCICFPHYQPILNKTKCVPIIEGFCGEHIKCSIENSVCVDHKCQCREKFQINSKNQCVLSSIGKKCTNDFKCDDSLHYKCNNGNCACQKNHILVDNISCLPLLEEFCWSNERCGPENSFCYDNKCQCKQNYKAAFKNECVLHDN